MSTNGPNSYNQPTSNASTTAPAEPPTHAEFIANGIVTLIVGLVSIVINALTAVVIARSKELRSPCFIILGAHGVFYSITAVGYFTNGITLCGYAFNFLSIACSRLNCYLLYLTMLITIPASSVITCFLGIDRMLAILCPLAYRRLGVHFAIGCLVAASVTGGAAAVAAGVTLPAPVAGTIMCFNFKTAFRQTFTSFLTNFNMSCYLLSVCFYASIVLIVKYKKFKKAGESGNSAEAERFLQSQLKLIPLINALAILYAICGIVPPFISLVFNIVADGRYIQRAWYYATMLKVCVSCVDFFILITKCAKFRLALRRFLGVSNQVGPSFGTVSRSRDPAPPCNATTNGRNLIPTRLVAVADTVL